MSSGKAQVNDDLEPGELPSYESLLVPASDREGDSIVSECCCARIMPFREAIPFLYRRKGLFISMIHAMHQEDASRCLCQIYQCFLNMLFSD